MINFDEFDYKLLSKRDIIDWHNTNSNDAWLVLLDNVPYIYVKQPKLGTKIRSIKCGYFEVVEIDPSDRLAWAEKVKEQEWI